MFNLTRMYIQFNSNVNKELRKSTTRRQQHFKLLYNFNKFYMILDVNSMHTKFEFNTSFETSSSENFDDYLIFINRKKNVAI